MKSLQLGLFLLFSCSAAPAQQYVISTIAGIPDVAGYFGDGSAALGAQIYQPLGVSIDSKQNLYIFDNYTYAVRMITASTGVISRIAGTGAAGFAGDNDVATSAQIRDIRGVVADSSGNVFISDTSNNRIRRIDSKGIISTFAGNGTRGYAGDGAAATAAQLWFPSGLALDGAGNLYVSDYGSYTVRKITPAGIISTVAGNGTAGYSGDGGPASKATLAAPGAIAFDSAGNLYIGDVSNGNIRRVGTDGNIKTVANATAQSLTVDAAGNIFFVDGVNPAVSRILRGGSILTIAGNGMTGFSGDGGAGTSAQLSRPNGVAVDPSGNVYVADTDNDVVRKLSPIPFSVGAVANAASGVQGSIAPGEIVAVFGAGIGPSSLTQFAVANGTIGSQIAGAQVFFNGVPAPLLYVSSTLSSAIVPYAVANAASADVVVSFQGNTSATTTVPVAATVPGIFTADASGTGQAAAVNQDGSLNAASNPAHIGSFVSLYLTGEGQTAPAGVDGKLALSSPYPAPQLAVKAFIGGQPALVSYAGAAPTAVAGLMQVNVQIPATTPPGASVAVQIAIGGVSSQTGATIAVAP